MKGLLPDVIPLLHRSTNKQRCQQRPHSACHDVEHNDSQTGHRVDLIFFALPLRGRHLKRHVARVTEAHFTNQRLDVPRAAVERRFPFLCWDVGFFLLFLDMLRIVIAFLVPLLALRPTVITMTVSKQQLIDLIILIVSQQSTPSCSVRFGLFDDGCGLSSRWGG